MPLNKLQELAKQENLSNKYLVELFYDDDFEGFWQETARFSSATDVLNFLECDLFEGLDTNLIGGLRVLDIENDGAAYQVNYKAPINTLHFNLRLAMLATQNLERKVA
jgi:hypothetical protein